MQIELTIESLSASRAVDRLARGGVEIFSARMLRKNAIVLRIAAKDRKKAFAILQGTCYNISKTASVGVKRALERLTGAAGLLLGLLLAVGGVAVAERRVLALEVVGSGAYYGREVREILAGGGVKQGSALPRDAAPLSARILALPRVEFCAFRCRGGVLTVEVNVSDDAAPLPLTPLRAPASGVVEELVVVRGTPLCAVGDRVEEGQTVVSCESVAGEERYPALAIARVTVSYSFSREYAGEEREALAQAELDFGQLREVHTEKTAQGWRVGGIALLSASVNLA